MALIEDVKRAKYVMLSSMDKGYREKMKYATVSEIAESLVRGIKNLREKNQQLRDTVSHKHQEYELVESAKRLKEAMAEFMGLPMPEEED